LVTRKITPQTLKNSRMTRTNLEIAGSARFFSSLLGGSHRPRSEPLVKKIHSANQAVLAHPRPL
jgi:hypothetical protein